MNAELASLADVLDAAVVIIHDVEGRILHWTSGCERLYGYPRSEAVGERVHDLLDTRYPVERAEIVATLAERGAWQGELDHRARDGSRLSVQSLWTTRQSADGATNAVLQNNHDVTSLRRTQAELAAREAHLSSILATVPDAMIVSDDHGVITSFSAGATALFGYSPDEIVGRNVKVLMPGPYRDDHSTYMDNYLRTGEARIIGYGRLVQAVTKDGKIFPVELAIGEATGAGRRIFTGFIRDLSSRQKMEQELRQAQKMDAIGQLTGGVAHDFNNILTAIIANLELLAPMLEDPDHRELAREAQGAAQDGSKLAAQLLAFARRQPLNPKPTDVGRHVAGFAEMLRRTLGEAVALELSVPTEALLAVVDGAQLQNAVLNLAINARDAMPRGGRLAVEISQVRLDPDYAQMYPEVRTGRYVLVTVTDTGSGMTEEVRRKAFDPFFTTKPVGSGTGLGLSMVYGFVKQSGGHIQLYSESGHGTSVRIYLPYAESAEPEAGPSRARPPELPKGSETILLVEDDPRLRRVLSRRLRSLGYAVVEADNGAQAMAELVARPEIALIFTDMVMPGGMTGLELAQAAVAMKPSVKILFTSGYAEPAIARLGLSSGAWLKKPYTADELAEKVREVLRQGG
ncbi:hybrid sensor histidine kinase/response regulator [Roseiarcus fermentans]|nr:PAS domain-containing sensor histidine kinase [Roseiarcus fermentans]